MKKIAIVLMTLALVGGTALAQRGPGGPGNGSHDGTGPKAELGQAVTATGTVVSFTAAAGEGQPTLVVRDSAGDHSFVLGPYRVIVAQGFAAEASNQVEVQGFVCTTCPTGVVVFQVKNLTTGLTLVLRNADGTPAWQGGPGAHQGPGFGGCGQQGQRGIGPDAGCSGTGPGMGHGPRGVANQARACNGEGPDMARVATFTGAVKSFTGGFGQGQPTLVVSTSAGDQTMLVSPFRTLRRVDYTPAVNAQIEVVAAPVTVGGTEEWVAVSLKDMATGLVIQLRDATTGLPIGGRGRA